MLPARETLYQSHRESLKSALANSADKVETGALGEFFIDISALSRAFPSEQALAEQIVAQSHQTVHLTPAVGIAANKFTALQAACQVSAETDHVWVVPKGDEQRLLAPLCLTVLPESPIELLRRLHLFDITTLGGFADLPYAAVVMQFGAECGFFHDLARGIDPRPLSPESPPPMLSRNLSLAEPLTDRRQVLAGALDYMGERRQLLWDIAEAYRLARRPKELPIKSKDERVKLPLMDARTRLATSFAFTGVSLEGHLTATRRDAFTRAGAQPIRELPHLKHGQKALTVLFVCRAGF